MNDREVINPKDNDSSYDNLAITNDSHTSIQPRLIIVQPRNNENEVDEFENELPNIQETVEYSIENQKQSRRDSLSSESIEELDIGQATAPTITYSDFNNIEHNNQTNKQYKIQVPNLIKIYKEKKDEEEKFRRKKSINIFDEKYIISDIIKNPTADITIVDMKSDLRKFLLTPPPKNVVVKCQINKTNNIDKTLMFTNFIFSLQMSDADNTLRRELVTLMVAHPNRNPKNFSFIISSDPSDISNNSSATIGQVKSNFLGKRFNIYSRMNSSQSSLIESDEDLENSNQWIKSNLNHIGAVFYKNSRFGSGKPRKIDVTIPHWDEDKENYNFETCLPKERHEMIESSDEGFIRLENVEPKYDEEKKCHTLDFGGRVKEVSVKNFALTMNTEGKMKRVFQFGKCRSHYIVDFTYPLCAFQAFAIGLSCCHRKISSE